MGITGAILLVVGASWALGPGGFIGSIGVVLLVMDHEYDMRMLQARLNTLSQAIRTLR